MFIWIVDGSVVIALIIIGILFLLGSAEVIADFILSNLTAIIIIALIIAVLFLISQWYMTKRFICGLFTIPFSSYWCFFSIYGLYKLSLFYEEHPFIALFLFLLYLMYVSGSSLPGLWLITEFEDPDDGRLDGGETFMINLAFLIIGIIGWVLNWVIFKVIPGWF